MVTFSEWDIGMKHRAFHTKEALIARIDLDGTDYNSVEEADADGLLDIKEIIIE